MKNNIKLLDAAKQYAPERVNGYYECEDYYCATDIHLAVLVPKSMIREEIELRTENKLNFTYILNSQPLNGDLKIRLGDLIDKLNEVPKIDGYVDCQYCDGDGQIECMCCSNIVECEDCYGTGKGKATGKKEIDPEYHILIGEYYLNVLKAIQITTGLVDSGYDKDSVLTVLSEDDSKPIVMDIDGVKLVSVTAHYSVIDRQKVIKLL